MFPAHSVTRKYQDGEESSFYRSGRADWEVTGSTAAFLHIGASFYLKVVIQNQSGDTFKSYSLIFFFLSASSFVQAESRPAEVLY